MFNKIVKITREDFINRPQKRTEWLFSIMKGGNPCSIIMDDEKELNKYLDVIKSVLNDDELLPISNVVVLWMMVVTKDLTILVNANEEIFKEYINKLSEIDSDILEKIYQISLSYISGTIKHGELKSIIDKLPLEDKNIALTYCSLDSFYVARIKALDYIYSNWFDQYTRKESESFSIVADERAIKEKNKNSLAIMVTSIGFIFGFLIVGLIVTVVIYLLI